MKLVKKKESMANTQGKKAVHRIAFEEDLMLDRLDKSFKPTIIHMQLKEHFSKELEV